MIRRVPIETKINHERWLVSYADFITLLFAFFVVMYSVSQVSEEKYKQLSLTLSRVFEGPPPSQESAAQQTTGTNEQQNAAVYSDLAELSQVQKELEQALAGLVEQRRVTLNGNEDWVEIDINANLIFNSGKSKLSDEAKIIFTHIAEVLAPYENAVEVSGHTDDIPISNSSFANNWELSSARAVSVVNWLAFHGVNPERLAAVGYGEFRPVAENTSEAGRAANRRVVLRVARDRAEQPKQEAQALLSEAGVEQAKTQAQSESPRPSAASPKSEPKLKPIKLENGGLLFTSDPESPRNKR